MTDYKERKLCHTCGRNYLVNMRTGRGMTVIFRQCPWCDGSMQRAGISEEETEQSQSDKLPMFAIWRYDQFPYILGGEVARVNDPADVVCVPYDSNVEKVRVCKYEVMGHYGGQLPCTVFDLNDEEFSEPNGIKVVDKPISTILNEEDEEDYELCEGCGYDFEEGDDIYPGGICVDCWSESEDVDEDWDEEEADEEEPRASKADAGGNQTTQGPSGQGVQNEIPQGFCRISNPAGGALEKDRRPS